MITECRNGNFPNYQEILGKKNIQCNTISNIFKILIIQVFITKPNSGFHKPQLEPTPLSISTENTKPTPMSSSTRNSEFPQNNHLFNVVSESYYSDDEEFEFQELEYTETNQIERKNVRITFFKLKF